MNNIVQANLKPNTVKRIAEITDKPVTRGLDKMINECFDKLQDERSRKKFKTGENKSD